MEAKFKVGDEKTVADVKNASAVGYLGSRRKIHKVEFDKEQQEFKYLTESVNGTGFAWFFESELK